MDIYGVSMPIYMSHIKLPPSMMWPELLYTDYDNATTNDADNSDDDRLFMLSWPLHHISQKGGP